MKIKSYYDPVRFAYLRPLLDKNGFDHCGNSIDGARKVAAFIYPKFNVYIDCIDREYPDSARGAVTHSQGKPFLYLKTAYSKVESNEIIRIVELAGGRIEPFFKWCGANLSDGFLHNLYPYRKNFINKDIEKKYSVGFCGSLDNHPVSYVSELRTEFYNKFSKLLGNGFYHNGKMKYNEYINEMLKWKLSFNCPGVGEYTSRIMDSSSMGIPPLLRKSTYDNAVSWSGYFPELDFASNDWEDQLFGIIDDYKCWGDKSLFYYEKYWTPNAIFDFMIARINVFMEENNLK